MLVSVEEGKPENLDQVENQQQAQPTCGTRPESNLGHIRGTTKLSLLPMQLIIHTVFIIPSKHPRVPPQFPPARNNSSPLHDRSRPSVCNPAQLTRGTAPALTESA